MKRKILSFATGLVLMSTLISPVAALADEETTKVFSYETYSVSYEIKSSWDNNQIIEVTLTNTGDEPILNWALEYDAEGEINGIWNGVIFDSNESSYVIKNSGYNYEILPEDSVTFGYTLTGDELDIPESITLCSQREDVDAESYSVSLSVSDDWGSGFNGLITIENLSDRPIEAWRLGFDANFEISNVWNAQLLSSDNNSYSVCSDITTTPIGVGETKTFGFAAVKDQDSIPEITNTSLSEVAINADLTDHNDDSSEIDDSSSEYSDDSSSENDDSSETDSSDVSSESDSSDESSEYEEPVVRPQTYTYEVRNEDCAVDEITVSMETAGDLEGTTTIESIMDKDVMCSGVVGLFGEPFDINTSSEFSSAVLTFKVDKSMLGDTEFDNLLFLWYDEENENFVELDTEHDEENSTVSTTVTHFSKYMLVDAKEWFENWNSIAEFMRTLLHPTSTGICISCSDVNDPLFNCDLDMIINGTASIETPNNYRKLILAQLIDLMKPGDLMFHIYGQTSRYGVLTSSSDLTDDKDALMTLDYQCSPSVEEIAGILIESHDKYWGKEKYNVYNKRTVIITDHDMSVDFEKLNPYYHYIMEIPVYFFCIGDFETPGLQNIVDHCGGDIYKVTTLSEFTDMLQKWGADKICGEKDYDHDGFSDVEEINGLIYNQSGNLVYTDYQKEDSDDDGLLDCQEVDVEMICEIYAAKNRQDPVVKYYHKMHSNPAQKYCFDNSNSIEHHNLQIAGTELKCSNCAYKIPIPDLQDSEVLNDDDYNIVLALEYTITQYENAIYNDLNHKPNNEYTLLLLSGEIDKIRMKDCYDGMYKLCDAKGKYYSSVLESDTYSRIPKGMICTINYERVDKDNYTRYSFMYGEYPSTLYFLIGLSNPWLGAGLQILQDINSPQTYNCSDLELFKTICFTTICNITETFLTTKYLKTKDVIAYEGYKYIYNEAINQSFPDDYYDVKLGDAMFTINIGIHCDCKSKAEHEEKSLHNRNHFAYTNYDMTHIWMRDNNVLYCEQS